MRIEKNLEIYGEAEYCFLTKPDTFFDFFLNWFTK